jgi:hypothetical protein
MPARAMLSTAVDGSISNGCRVCGWATLPGSSLCVGCLDIREWSRVNRAFCDLLHRALAFDPEDADVTGDVTVVDFAMTA